VKVFKGGSLLYTKSVPETADHHVQYVAGGLQPYNKYTAMVREVHDKGENSSICRVFAATVLVSLVLSSANFRLAAALPDVTCSAVWCRSIYALYVKQSLPSVA